MADADFIASLCKDTKLIRSLDSDVASQTIEEGIKHVISKTQENCRLSKVYQRQWHPEQGEVIHPYIHNLSRAANFALGKIGSLVVRPHTRSSYFLVPSSRQCEP